MQTSNFSSIWRWWAAQLRCSLLAKLQRMVRAVLLWVVTAGPIPSHIAFIMDGNRRFADRLHVDRHIGHSHGYDALLRTLKDCFDLHVKTVTLYAFSIDNFQRPPDEVSALMDLMQSKLADLVEKEGLASQYGIRIRILGDLSLLPDGARAAAEKAMAVTSKNSFSVLNLCISYTSTREIAQSIEQTCGNALNALGNNHRFYGDLGDGGVVTGGGKEWDVPTTLSSPMSECSCALDHNCSDPDGSSELSNSDSSNGMQECLHAQLEEGHGSAGNSDPSPGNVHHHVVGKNHGIYARENGFSPALEEGRQSGEVSVDSTMVSELMCVRSSAHSTGLRRRTSHRLGISENSFPQDFNSVSIHNHDSSESQTSPEHGDSACMKEDTKEGGCSMVCDSADCAERKLNKCQQSPKCSSTSNSSMKQQLHSYQPRQQKGSFAADNAARNTDKARKEDRWADAACGEHCCPNDSIFKLVQESVSEEEIEKHLYTGPSCPPPDLLIRTSGETRLSNFLLWQSSFSHLAFCKVLWPEFTCWHLFLIILEYQRSLPMLLRKRRNCNTASLRN